MSRQRCSAQEYVEELMRSLMQDAREGHERVMAIAQGEQIAQGWRRGVLWRRHWKLLQYGRFRRLWMTDPGASA